MTKNHKNFIKILLVLFVLIILGGLLFLILNSEKKETPREGKIKVKQTNLSICGLPDGDQSIPSTAPKANWELRGSVAVPVAPETFGPKVFKDDMPSCFAHSPTGALFAAVNIDAALHVLARQSLTKEQQLRALNQFIATGPGLDAARAKVPEDGSSPSSEVEIQLAGFKVVHYEKDSALIDLAFKIESLGINNYSHITQTMRWEKGDWKLVLSQTGESFDSLGQIPDLNGYVVWNRPAN